ncbi:MAG: hypothetical protein HYV34_03915 [Candidatus Kerfeldbacteria bacterium]|nr:hypothetical protein [Candidatus Kerfeldbacteria bacterium]
MADAFYRDFIRELFTRTKFVNPNGAVDEAQVESMANELEKRMGLSILNTLPKEQMEPYFTLIKQDVSAQKIQDFLRTNISDFDDKRRAVLENFARDFVRRTETMRQALS